MFVKTTARKTKSGTVRYLHLAHSEWDPVAGRSVPKILYGFGREDQLDRDAIKRLVGSLTRLLDPADAQAARARARELTFCESRPFGGTFTLDALWRRLGIDTVLSGLDTGPDGTPRRGRPREIEVTERVLFGLVANRALAPSSKLAAADWINHDVHIDGLPADLRRRLLPGDGLAARRPRTARDAGCFARSRTCSTSRSTCCSSIIRLIAGLLSRWPGSWCCFAAFERADFFFLPADFRGDGVEGLGEVVDAVGQPGEGEQFAVAGAVAVDDRAEVAAAVAGGAADAGCGGDGGEGDVRAGGDERFAGRADPGGVGGRVRVGSAVGFVSGGCRSFCSGVGDQLVEAVGEAAVSVGFVGPAAGFGVRGERGGVGALGGEHGEEAGVGAEVRAVLADVGVGAGSLGGGAQAEPAGEPGLDRGGVFPVAAAGDVGQRQRAVAARGSGAGAPASGAGRGGPWPG